ncbi:WS/DGAT/MGAT family O-acyltransferase [Segniliparus rugosus]|uniref:Diacylglycerol O-acyltransferase n=1 Tax=Segniliparus rugosus (strain ATCC BAA-974 / DSM 45345 / CCUG 50838 / CIP 108380 / JCM 13579 / CDC 945) TaxID=679197 RepID=E5XT71_SEGRC|nr:wax ester/triacylglycerol synthase family O-acyltransferase [Segniliparus rugosus]EFV12482.1 acyltransferase, WS/DGAT/MGAT [Segniliparus rugosus ATCC BAA-974]
MPLMPISDAMFLLMESREHPMHVGAVQLFQPPPEAGPDYGRVFHDQLLATADVSGDFRRRPGQPLASARALRWATDPELDFEYHVRRLALPSLAGMDELFALVSRLHSAALDRHRPLWELAVIEGLADGKLAIYTKVHHSLIDGVGALRTLLRTLSDDSEALDCPAVWAQRGRREPAQAAVAPRGPFAMIRGARAAAKGAAEVAPGLARYGAGLVRGSGLVRPMQAPRTMLNVPIGGARRVAARSWPLQRVKTLGKTLDGTVNDVVLAMSAGALRAYLSEQGALPDKPLVAACPVSMRKEGDQNAGNAITSLLANLATDKADPGERFEAIVRSVRSAKSMLATMTPLQQVVTGLINTAPAGLGGFPVMRDRAAPAFNIGIANVPGPSTARYWNRAELVGLYPASIAMDGLALNITVTSTADALHFGLTGCRSKVPHLPRILGHLEDSLAELEAAAGV